MIEVLKTEKEAWSLAQEQCRRGAEQLCLQIQADADAKIQRISSDAATLQQQVLASPPRLERPPCLSNASLMQVRAAADERAAALGAIVHKREEREELVAGAAASPEVE